MDKGIGFNRTVRLTWLNAAADLRSQSDDPATLRQGLEEVLLPEMSGVEARRKTIDQMVNIWMKSAEVSPSLYGRAIELLPEVSEPHRIWLHYGLALLYYPYFRQCTALIGQLARVRDTFTRQMVKDRLAAGNLGQLGSIGRTSDHLMASLLDWGVLVQQARNEYRAEVSKLAIDHVGVQGWLLACALFSNPAHELPFADLLNLPELFPFRIAVSLDDLRQQQLFVIQNQGGWMMVRLAETRV
jgi:hypothetical protein